MKDSELTNVVSTRCRVPREEEFESPEGGDDKELLGMVLYGRAPAMSR